MNSQSGKILNSRKQSAKKRDLTADKVQTFLLKDKKQRTINKPKKPEDLKTNQAQDESVNLTKILSFYRARVDAHEKDRLMYLKKMNDLRVKQETAHQVEWELKKRAQESDELQTALAQCQGFLGQERGTIAEMKDGGDELRLKQSRNKQQILELLESSNSVEQHVYYQKGETPEKIQQYYLGTKGAGITGGVNTMAPITKPDREPVKSTMSFKQPKKPNVLRTIYMPNFEVDAARDQINILRKEIEDERLYYQDIMKNLQDEKASFEEQQRNVYLVSNNKYQETMEQLHQKETYNQSIVMDHIELKHIFELEERVQQEENEQLNQSNYIMRNGIRELCSDTKSTVSNAKREYEHNSEEFSAKFREQNVSHDQNMSIIRDQYNKLKALHKSKTQALQERSDKESTRLGQMQSKRKLDLEGYSSDLQNLKKRMVFYQNYIGKLKKLVDRDQARNAEDGENIFGSDQDIVLEQIVEEEE